MSAVIQNEYTGNNSTTTYSFTFPYLKTSDIKASLDGVATTAFTLPNATTLQFNTAPTNGAKIKIFRQTSVDNLTATFYAGSAIKSEDLNDNFTQNLYKTQEIGGRFISNLGGTMTGDLNMGEDTVIKFEGATDDAHETTLTVADPTADRTITFPNVTGTVVTTGDTGTVATGMIAGDAVNGDKIADNAINSEHYTDGSIDRVHLAADIVDGTKIADDSINSEHYVADSIDTEHYAAGSVDATALGSNAVTGVKIIADAVDGTKIADNSINSEHYVDGSIDNVHLANDAVNQAKMADDSIGAAELIDNAVGEAALASNSVTNVKMADNAVGTSELVNDAVVADKIAANAVTTAKINADAIVSSKIADNAIGNEHLQDDSVRSAEIQSGAVGSTEIASSAIIEAKIANDAVTSNKVADNAITTGKIQDGELKTLAGMVSATASKLAEAQTLTADINDLNIVDGMTKQTTISDTDSSYPTSGAVVDYVAAQIAPLGGLEVIATEDNFPTQPISGVVISISDASGIVVQDGTGGTTAGRSTTARTDGNGSDNVTINNFPTSLHGETLATGVGLMVSSTGSGNIYNYHKILAAETDVKQLSDDINDFNARYRVGSSNPTSALDSGDLFFNTGTGKLLVYNGTNSAWEEAQSIGNFFISTFSEAFDGSRTQFTLSNAPTNVQQILLSLNGVVQKPGTAFTLSGSTVTLASAPASGTDYFAVVMGSTVNIGTPSNNTVSSAILQNGSVITTKIAGDAVDGSKIADNSIDSEHYVDGSIDTAHIANDAVDATKLANSINTEIAANTAKVTNATHTGDVTGSTSLTLAASGVSAGSYGSSSAIPVITVDAKGRITAASTAATSSDLVADTSPQLGGDLDTNSHNISLDDDHKVFFGDSSDLQIYHEGGAGDNIIKNNVAGKHLKIQHKTSGGSVVAAATFYNNTSVELYNAGNKKFETTSTGVSVTGGVTASAASYLNGTLNCQGSDDTRVRLNVPSGNGDDWNYIGFYGENGTRDGFMGTWSDGTMTMQQDGGSRIRLLSSAVEVVGGIFPLNNNQYDLGTSSNRWQNIYTNDLNLSNKGSSNDVDGTWGDWTIQEGESDLFLKNNRSGKKYKFNLTEVS